MNLKKRVKFKHGQRDINNKMPTIIILFILYENKKLNKKYI